MTVPKPRGSSRTECPLAHSSFASGLRSEYSNPPRSTPAGSDSKFCCEIHQKHLLFRLRSGSLRQRRCIHHEILPRCAPRLLCVGGCEEIGCWEISRGLGALHAVVNLRHSTLFVPLTRSICLEQYRTTLVWPSALSQSMMFHPIHTRTPLLSSWTQEVQHFPLSPSRSPSIPLMGARRAIQFVVGSCWLPRNSLRSSW